VQWHTERFTHRRLGRHHSRAAHDGRSVRSRRRHPAIDADNRQGPEVVGDATDATVYGLMFTHSPPVRAGDEVKIVWRMTGQGDLSVRFVDPDGRQRPLVFGPEPHGSSNYDRPGDEWGTGFLFDRAGCWQIHLQRDVGVGDVWIDVVA
jgi:hypothetical protein